MACSSSAIPPVCRPEGGKLRMLVELFSHVRVQRVAYCCMIGALASSAEGLCQMRSPCKCGQAPSDQSEGPSTRCCCREHKLLN